MNIILTDGRIEMRIIYKLKRPTLHRSFGQSCRWSVTLPKAKNVTNLGLPRVNRGLHIVCPKDSQRYYLLFTRIHKLFAPLFTSIRTLLKTSTPPSPS